LSHLINKLVLFILSFCLVFANPVLGQQGINFPNFSVNLPDFSIHDSPVLSTFNVEKNKAPVTLDGRELFQVGEFNNSEEPIAAAKRAEEITKLIEKAVKSRQSPQLEIKKVNGLPTILLNEAHLFTVTSAEITNGETTDEKANSLQKKIKSSIVQAQDERSTRSQYQQYVLAGLVLSLAIILHRVLTLLKDYSLVQTWKYIFPWFGLAYPEKVRERSLFTKLKLDLLKLLIWLGTFYWLSDLFPMARSLRYETLSRFWAALNSPRFFLSNSSYSIISILVLLGLFWALIYLTKTFTKLLRNSFPAHILVNRASQEVFFIITQYGLLAIGTIILLQVWGVNLSSLTILGSAFGVGIGFGFQDIAKNFASGLVLLFERSVQIGDFIEINGHKGTVEKVGARSIVLRTLDRISIIVPNSRLLADEVVNWTHEGSISRLHLPVGVAYGSDSETVKAVLFEVATNHPEILRSPPPQVFFVGLGESSLDFELLVWISEPRHQLRVKSDLYFEVEKLLSDREISIPFPQRDIQLRGSNLAFNLSPTIETALLKWLETEKPQESRNGNGNGNG